MSDEVIEAPVESTDKPKQADEPKTYATVHEAVAELERREQEAEEAAKAEAKEKARKEEQARRLKELRERTAEKKAEEAKAEEAEGTDDDAEEDTEDESESEDDAEDVKAKKPDEKDEPEEDEEVAEVEHEGKRYKIPKALEGAMLRQADYTRKTQELAEERRAVHEQHKSTSELLRQVQSAQEAVVQMAMRMVGNPPPIELARENPGEYQYQKAMYEARLAELQRLTGHGKALTQQQQQQAALKRQQALQAEAKEMLRHLPQLADPAKRDEFMRDVSSVAGRYGFTADEIAAVDDHRMIRLLGDLVTLQRRAEKAGDIKQKLANVPPKSLKPGTATTDQGASDRQRRAKAAFMKSGRTLKDVQRYLAAMES